MSAFFDFLRRHAATSPGGTAASDSHSSDGLLAQARTLAREGREHQASRLYADIRRKHETLEIVLEHAALQLELGDHFGAACSATRALELHPGHPKAMEIRAKILSSS